MSSPEDWQDQPPVTRAVVGIAGSVVTLGADVFGYSLRMSSKAETLLDEYIGLLQDARPLVSALADAVDSGLIEDLRRGMRILETTVNQVALVSNRLDQAVTQIGRLVPTVDKTARGMRKVLPVIESLPETQDDIRAAREAAARVESLINLTLDQVNLIPGAKLVRGLAGGRKSSEDPPEKAEKE